MINPKCSLTMVLVGAPLMSAALDLRDQPVHGMASVPLAAVPADLPESRQPTLRLRDALRQPLAEKDASGKVYRLSPEERQRLREQLRVQPEQSARSQ